MLINLKMSTFVGILSFMSRINLVLSWIEHEKSFITSGPDLLLVLSNSEGSVIRSQQLSLCRVELINIVC